MFVAAITVADVTVTAFIVIVAIINHAAPITAAAFANSEPIKLTTTTYLVVVCDDDYNVN